MDNAQRFNAWPDGDARAELRSWRSSVDVVSIGEMDSAPPPASRASLDVVVNELPMDVNVAFYLHTESP